VLLDDLELAEKLEKKRVKPAPGPEGSSRENLTTFDPEELIRSVKMVEQLYREEEE